MALTTTEEYMRFFREHDKNKDGSLTLEEIMPMFKSKGYTEKEIKGFFKSCDTDGNNEVSEQEFLEAMGCVPPSQKTGAAMRMVFRDFDRDGNGMVSKDELNEMFKEMGKHFSDYELDRMIKLMDKDGNQEVEYEEFIQFFCGDKK